MRRLLIAVAAVAALAASSPAQATARTETFRYVGGPGDLTALNCDGNLKVAEEGIGGVCFDVLRGDTSVSLTVDDASGTPTSITYIFRDSAGDSIGEYLQFCGSSGPLAIPTGAAVLIAYVDEALAALSPCEGTPGTTGTITGSFA